MSTGSISLVIPTHNVAKYLPDFLASLDEQNDDDVEVVFVDDGSTDDSRELIEKWIGKGRPNTRIVSQPNGGLASARNRGLDEVSGDWVSFPDPDDRLSPGYLATVRAFLRSDKAAVVHLIATNLLILDDATGAVSDNHPLRFKFAEGQRVVDLARFPNHIHLQAASAFYRRALLDRLGLRFDHRIRPNFEDAALTALYLATFDRPRLAVLPNARYLYRQRAAGNSLVQSSWRLPEKYTDLLEHGYLAVLKTIAAQHGPIPLWAQNLVLYDLSFYFRTDSRPNSPTGGLSTDVSARFHALLKEIFAYIDTEAIKAFRVIWLSADIRAAMLLGAKGVDAVPIAVRIDAMDKQRRLVRMRYYFSGEPPREKIRARGLLVAPVHAKLRSVRFMGATMLYQRITWLPATGTLSVELNGRGVPILLGGETLERYSVGPTALWKTIAKQPPPPDIYRSSRRGNRPRTLRSTLGAWKRRLRASVPRPDPAAIKRGVAERILKRRARFVLVRRRYRDAWLLIDRDSQAQDNAEWLYRYLREHRQQVNAWFVLSRDSTDWDRLERDGFRLIEHRSRQHTFALLNCRHVISSQIDHYIVQPLDARLGPRKWHYTFLQHGVTKDDLSVWINPKPIDLMITATPDEHESIVGDATPYVLTGREVRMTGFPRHDRLLELAQLNRESHRKLILIMPTWRRELVLEQIAGGNDRRLREDFWQTEYATRWREVAEAERLRELAESNSWEICLIPHPNMQDYLANSPVSRHVMVRRFKDIDVQQMLAKAAVLVTDYSSMAFEMAYIERPVVYFQFDREEFFSGVHAYRRGTWSYEQRGFGPICMDSERAIDEIVAVMERGGVADPHYAERMLATFPLRDGRCSERTYQAIVDIDRELSYDELYLRTEPPETLAGEPVE